MVKTQKICGVWSVKFGLPIIENNIIFPRGLSPSVFNSDPIWSPIFLPPKNNQTEIISPTAMIIFMQIWFYVYIYIFSVILHYLCTVQID